MVKNSTRHGRKARDAELHTYYTTLHDISAVHTVIFLKFLKYSLSNF